MVSCTNNDDRTALQTALLRGHVVTSFRLSNEYKLWDTLKITRHNIIMEISHNLASLNLNPLPTDTGLSSNLPCFYPRTYDHWLIKKPQTCKVCFNPSIHKYSIQWAPRNFRYHAMHFHLCTLPNIPLYFQSYSTYHIQQSAMHALASATWPTV